MMNLNTLTKSPVTHALITGWTLVVLGLGNGGCQYMQTGEGQGTAAGAGAGAVAGGLLGLLFKDKRLAVPLIALAGAGVGALIGQQIGKAVDEKRKKYDTEEKFMDAQVKDAREKRQAVATLNNSLKSEIAGLRRQQGVNSAQAALQAKDLEEKSNVDKILTGLDNDIKINTEALRTTKTDPSHTAGLKDEVARMEKERDELTARRNELLGIQGKPTT